jgi:hypothetical protein
MSIFTQINSAINSAEPTLKLVFRAAIVVAAYFLVISAEDMTLTIESSSNDVAEAVRENSRKVDSVSGAVEGVVSVLDSKR